MKTLTNTFILTLIFISFSFQMNAQQSFECEGSWQIKANKQTFCNVIMMSNVEGNEKDVAVVEGLIDNKPFSVKCVIEKIPHRNSIVLNRISEESHANSNKTQGPVLILVTNKKQIEKVVWGLLDITKSRSIEADQRLRIKKLEIPNYREMYNFKTSEKDNILVASSGSKE